MGWDSVGKLSPSGDWVFYPGLIVNSEVVRIIQTFRAVSYPYPALLGQYFGTPGGLARIHKVWGIEGPPRIIQFQIPEAFKEDGEFVYQMALRSSFPRAQYTDWDIEVQAYY